MQISNFSKRNENSFQMKFMKWLLSLKMNFTAKILKKKLKTVVLNKALKVNVNHIYIYIYCLD